MKKFISITILWVICSISFASVNAIPDVWKDLGNRINHGLNVVGNKINHGLNVAGNEINHGLNVAGNEINHGLNKAGNEMARIAVKYQRNFIDALSGFALGLKASPEAALIGAIFGAIAPTLGLDEKGLKALEGALNAGLLGLELGAAAGLMTGNPIAGLVGAIVGFSVGVAIGAAAPYVFNERQFRIFEMMTNVALAGLLLGPEAALAGLIIGFAIGEYMETENAKAEELEKKIKELESQGRLIDPLQEMNEEGIAKYRLEQNNIIKTNALKTLQNPSELARIRLWEL